MKSLLYSVTIIALLLWGLNPYDSHAQDDFEEWKQQQEAEFQDFKNEQDAAFMEMLQEAWEFIETDGSSKLFEEDKFEQPPQATEADQEEQTAPPLPNLLLMPASA